VIDTVPTPPIYYKIDDSYQKYDDIAKVSNVEKKKFLHNKDEIKIIIPKDTISFEDVKKLVLESYNSKQDPLKKFKTVNSFYCNNVPIQSIDQLNNCKNKIIVYFDNEQPINRSCLGGWVYHNRRRSSSCRRLFSKKCSTRRKQKRRQRRGYCRSH
jgi:hypothetical protein